MSITLQDHEPLNWLIASLFTDRFLDRHYLIMGFTDDSPMSVLANMYADKKADEEKPEFDSPDDLYAAIDDFIKNDEKASQCLARATEALQNNQITKFVPTTDEWGETWEINDPLKVNTFEFLQWAEQEGHPLPQSFMPGLESFIQRHVSKKESERQQQYQFPEITPEQFMERCKEPLWDLGTAVLYLFGHRSRPGPEKCDDFIRFNKPAERFVEYLRDAHKAGHLKLIDYVPDAEKPKNLLHAHIEPHHLIAWAKTLPLELPMLGPQSPQRHPTIPAHITPDMELMFDAIQKFWAHYDLSSPNISVAPMKKDVTNWLITEAKNRGIDDFSKTRADIMDTIIRCPKSRKGGNSL